MAKLVKLSALAATGIFVYAYLIYVGGHDSRLPMGDLSLAYQYWVNNHSAYGLTSDWVYPFLALVPMVLANTFAPGHLELPWLLGCGLLTVVVAVLVASVLSTKRAYLAMYFWFATLLLLGPVSISRLDTISVIFAVLAVFSIARHKNLDGAVWLTIATWIKVWPVALLMAIFAATRKRLGFLAAVLALNLGVVTLGILLGGNSSVFSFLAGQAGRGIQIEAPIAEFWLWPSVFGSSGFGILYDQNLMTFQVAGPNIPLFATLISITQIGALLITLTLGLIGRRRGASFESVLFWVAFTGIVDLIFFNKVGSPQYQTWLVVPVVYGLVVGLPKMRTPVILVLALSLLTWLVYPITYDGLLQGNWFATGVLTARNLLLFAALIYGNLGLQQLGKQRADNL